jgi:hypothetical protein
MWAAIAAAIVLGGAVREPSQPQGRIVFASARTTVAQLYSVEPSGEGLAQLTFGKGNWGFPVPSPDGRFVAAFRGPELWLNYVGDPLAVAPRPGLWVMRADGTGARRLAADATNVSWLADSRRLVYWSDGDMWTARAAGGRPRRITMGYTDRALGLSLDGRSLAFVRNVDAPMLMIRRNGRERVIAPGDYGRLAWSRLAWSPDGKWIAIRDYDTISVVRTTGGLVQTFSPPRAYCIAACLAPGIAWSPDSSLIAYEDRDGIELMAGSGGMPRLLVKGATQGFAWSPLGDAIVFDTRAGIGVATLDGQVRMLARFGPGEPQPGVGWSRQARLGLRTPEPTPLLVQASRELEARFPIREFSADGDRVAYWLCPHSLGVWRPGDAQTVALGPPTFAACRVFSEPTWPRSGIYDLTLAGDRLAYLTVYGGNTLVWQLVLASAAGGDEGDVIDTGADSTHDPSFMRLEDLLGGGSALVYGARARDVTARPGPESVWRVDGATPAQVARRTDDLQPLSADGDRIVARRHDAKLELLNLDGALLATFAVPSLGAALAGDDLVVLVQGELRDYSASTGDLLHAWPLPDVASAGRCRRRYCPPVRLTLDDAARGVAVYTLDGTVHLLRLRDGADYTVPDATAAELTDAGLFYTYAGAPPWPGRIRFVPFSELPL